MKTILCPQFNPACPEDFNWDILDSPKLSVLASDLARQCKAELDQPVGNRVNVPGLRFALLRIAGLADL